MYEEFPIIISINIGISSPSLCVNQCVFIIDRQAVAITKTRKCHWNFKLSVAASSGLHKSIDKIVHALNVRFTFVKLFKICVCHVLARVSYL